MSRDRQSVERNACGESGEASATGVFSVRASHSTLVRHPLSGMRACGYVARLEGVGRDVAGVASSSSCGAPICLQCPNLSIMASRSGGTCSGRYLSIKSSRQ